MEYVNRLDETGTALKIARAKVWAASEYKRVMVKKYGANSLQAKNARADYDAKNEAFMAADEANDTEIAAYLKATK
jgi:hypothetical protein